MVLFSTEFIVKQLEIIENYKETLKKCYDQIENFPLVMSSSDPTYIEYKKAAIKYYPHAIEEIELLQFERQTWINKANKLQTRLIGYYQEFKRLKKYIAELEDKRENIELLLLKAEKRIEKLEWKQKWYSVSELPPVSENPNTEKVSDFVLLKIWGDIPEICFYSFVSNEWKDKDGCIVIAYEDSKWTFIPKE